MRFIKWFLNLIYFSILICGMFVVSLGCNFLISAQSGETDSSFVVWSMDEKSYGVNDAFEFISNNVQTNYKLYKDDGDIDYSSAMFVIEYEDGEDPIEIRKPNGTVQIDSLYLNIQGPKVRARNWIGLEWWAEYPGYWIDYAIDFVASIGSPIFLPVYNAANLAKFYNPEMEPGDPLILTTEIIDELSKKYGPDYVTRAVQDLYSVQTESYLPGSSITTYHKWIKAYTHFYSYMFNIAKYNALTRDAEGNYIKVYEEAYNKIVVNKDGVDDRRVNANVISLYYTVVLCALGSGFVVWQFPITTEADSEGRVQVKNGLFRKRRHRRAGIFARKKEE